MRCSRCKKEKEIDASEAIETKNGRIIQRFYCKECADYLDAKDEERIKKEG